MLHHPVEVIDLAIKPVASDLPIGLAVPIVARTLVDSLVTGTLPALLIHRLGLLFLILMS